MPTIFEAPQRPMTAWLTNTVTEITCIASIAGHHYSTTASVGVAVAVDAHAAGSPTPPTPPTNKSYHDWGRIRSNDSAVPGVDFVCGGVRSGGCDDAGGYLGGVSAPLFQACFKVVVSLILHQRRQGIIVLRFLAGARWGSDCACLGVLVHACVV